MNYMSNKSAAVMAAIACVIIPASLLLAKPKKPTDQDVCSGKQAVVYDNCTANGGSAEYCGQAALRRYNQCMQNKGHAPGSYAPSEPSSPTPTPRVGASIHPISGGATNKQSNQPSPTPSAPPRHQKQGKG
jgi:hypothetical protein